MAGTSRHSAIPNQETTTIADQLITNWVTEFGVPRKLHSDQGRNFESDICKRMYEALRIHETWTAIAPTIGRNGLIVRQDFECESI